MTALNLYFVGPREIKLREGPVPEPGEGEVRVRTERSAISAGTELRIYRGEASPDLPVDPTIKALPGTLAFPLQYGYAAVGRVSALGEGVEKKWLDRRVFAFHPHASHFVASPTELHPLPDGCETEAATLLPTVETAVNLVLDGAPLIGERVVVFGQGVVGLSTTALLSRFPLGRLLTVERLARRRELSDTLGADSSLESADEVAGALGDDGGDLSYELTGDPAGLDAAIDATGYGGRVVVGSWYGQRPATLQLDGRFHRSRVRMEASQVSTIAPRLRGRWTKGRRIRVAWRWLDALDTDQLITHRFPVDRANEAYQLLDERPEEAVQVMLTY